MVIAPLSLAFPVTSTERNLIAVIVVIVVVTGVGIAAAAAIIVNIAIVIDVAKIVIVVRVDNAGIDVACTTTEVMAHDALVIVGVVIVHTKVTILAHGTNARIFLKIVNVFVVGCHANGPKIVLTQGLIIL